MTFSGTWFCATGSQPLILQLQRGRENQLLPSTVVSSHDGGVTLWFINDTPMKESTKEVCSALTSAVLLKSTADTRPHQRPPGATQGAGLIATLLPRCHRNRE